MKILLNSIFTGKYGADDGNLPHEVIDFFHSDNGKHYIYITPYGTVNPHMYGEELSSVLLIRSVGNRMVQVIAKAQPPFILYTQGAVLNKTDWSLRQRDLFRQYEENLVNGKITYAGLQPEELFQSNKPDNEIHITLQIEKMYLPKKQILLTNCETRYDGRTVFYIPTTARLANQSMKIYFDSEDPQEAKAYEALYQIANRDDLWSAEWIPPELSRDSLEEAIKTVKENIRLEKGQERFENSLSSFESEMIKNIHKKEVE